MNYNTTSSPVHTQPLNFIAYCSPTSIISSHSSYLTEAWLCSKITQIGIFCWTIDQLIIISGQPESIIKFFKRPAQYLSHSSLITTL